MATDAAKQAGGKKKGTEPLWLIYVAALLSGIVLLADAVDYTPLQKIPARLGIALVFSALALFIGMNRRSAFVAAALIWVVTILTFFV